MAGGGEKILPPNDIPLPEFRDVTFAYATPGASDPQHRRQKRPLLLERTPLQPGKQS